MTTKALEVVSIDNRDPNTTWLWIDGGHYIEVDPFDLVRNTIENCGLTSMIEKILLDRLDSIHHHLIQE